MWIIGRNNESEEGLLNHQAQHRLCLARDSPVKPTGENFFFKSKNPSFVTLNLKEVDHETHTTAN